MEKTFRSTQIQETRYKIRSALQYTMPKINDSINEMLSNIDKLRKEVDDGKICSGEGEKGPIRSGEGV